MAGGGVGDGNGVTTMFFVNHNTLAMNINHKDCQIEINEKGELKKIDFLFDSIRKEICPAGRFRVVPEFPQP